MVGAPLITATSAYADNGPLPSLECVSKNSATNELTAYWGYVNAGNSTLTIPPGSGNSFFPLPAFRGQPVTFPAGIYHNLFSVTFSLNVTSSLT